MSDCFDHYMDAMEDAISGRTFDEGYQSDNYVYTSKQEWIYNNLKNVKRICIKCNNKFKSRIPMACPQCGGWNNKK